MLPYFHVFSVIYKLHQHLIQIPGFRDELDLFFAYGEILGEYYNHFLATGKIKFRSLLCSLLYAYTFNSYFSNDCVIYFQNCHIESILTLFTYRVETSLLRGRL